MPVPVPYRTVSRKFQSFAGAFVSESGDYRTDRDSGFHEILLYCTVVRFDVIQS